MGAYLQKRLEEVARDRAEVVRDVRGLGLLRAMELRGRRKPRPREASHPAWPRVRRVRDGLRREGIWVGANADGSSLVLCPPFILKEAQVDRLADRLTAHLGSF